MPQNLEGFLQDLLGGIRGSASRYPTEEEIMAGPMPTHKPAVLSLVKEWKREVWKPVKTGSPEQRFEAIKTLLSRIAVEHYQRPVEVVYSPGLLSSCYSPQLNRIALNESLSIVTALHELAHHLFGPDEKKACRWSVHLFKKAFPKAFEKLEFRGHMLVKRQECSVS